MFDLVAIQDFLEHLSTDTLRRVYNEARFEHDHYHELGNMTIVNSSNWLMFITSWILSERNELPV